MRAVLRSGALLLAIGICSVVVGQDAPTKVDPELPSYAKRQNATGKLSSVGSDTLDAVMRAWTREFSEIHPGVGIMVEGKGSNTAPLALTGATSDLGPMSREMRPAEIDAFSARHGYPPTKLRVALDALAIFVHKDNPLSELTLQQVDAIFSRGRKRGYQEDVTTWGQLGLTGDWAKRKINLYSRNTLSGTYTYFKEHVLKEGEFKASIKEEPGSAVLVHDVAEDQSGIGYSGLGYVIGEVKKLKIAAFKGDEAAPADALHVYDGTYPIFRPLYTYINRAPGKPLSPSVAEFCRYILSREGQTQVAKEGYIPLPAALAKEDLKKLE